MLQDLSFIMQLRYDKVHSANLEHVSEWHIFQNGTQHQSETCFRMAHVSEQRATHTLARHVNCVLAYTTYIQLKGTNSRQKTWDLPCLLHLLFWFHVSNYHNFWNNERWKSCIKYFSIMKLFHLQKPLSKWR